MFIEFSLLIGFSRIDNFDLGFSVLGDAGDFLLSSRFLAGIFLKSPATP
jgi:hypothetical protein